MCVRITLARNSWRELSLSFNVPSNTTAGNISTVIVTVGGSDVTDIENCAVFYIYVKPKVTSVLQELLFSGKKT